MFDLVSPGEHCLHQVGGGAECRRGGGGHLRRRRQEQAGVARRLAPRRGVGEEGASHVYGRQNGCDGRLI